VHGVMLLIRIRMFPTVRSGKGGNEPWVGPESNKPLVLIFQIQSRSALTLERRFSKLERSPLGVLRKRKCVGTLEEIQNPSLKSASRFQGKEPAAYRRDSGEAEKTGDPAR